MLSDLAYYLQHGDSIFFDSLVVAFIILTIFATKKYLALLPLKFLIAIAALALNLLCKHWDYHIFAVNWKNFDPQTILMLCLPFFIANVSLKCLASKHTRLYGICATILTISLGAILNGYLVSIFMHPEWDWRTIHIYGIALCSINADSFRYIQDEATSRLLRQLTNNLSFGTVVISLPLAHVYLASSEWLPFIRKFAVYTICAVFAGLPIGVLYNVMMIISSQNMGNAFIVIIANVICGYWMAIRLNVSPSITMCAVMAYVPSFMREFAGQELLEYTDRIIDYLIYTYCMFVGMYVLVNEKNSLYLSVAANLCIIFVRALIQCLMVPVVKRMIPSVRTRVIVSNSFACITSNYAFIISFMLYANADTMILGRLLTCHICISALFTNWINYIAFQGLTLQWSTIGDQFHSAGACFQHMRRIKRNYRHLRNLRNLMGHEYWSFERESGMLIRALQGEIDSRYMPIHSTDCAVAHTPTRWLEVDETTKSARLVKKEIKHHLRAHIINMHMNEEIRTSCMIWCVKIVRIINFVDHHMLHFFRKSLETCELRANMNELSKILEVPRKSLVTCPSSRIYRLCFKYVHNKLHIYVSNALGFYMMICLYCGLGVRMCETSTYHVMLCMNFIHLMGVIANALTFVAAGSVISIREGLTGYFKSIWHCLEFAAMIINAIDLLTMVALSFANMGRVWRAYKFIRLLRLYEFVFMLKEFTSKLNNFAAGELQIKSDVQMAKTLYYTYKRIGHKLDTILPPEYSQLVQMYKAWLKVEQRDLYEVLATLEMRYPMMGNVNVRYILSAYYYAIHSRHETDYLEEDEYNTLIRKFQYIELPGNEVFQEHRKRRDRHFWIFNRLPWWSSYTTLIKDYLRSVAVKKKYAQGEVICHHGGNIGGIIIVLEGSLLVEYEPDSLVDAKLEIFGELPAVKYYDLSFYRKSIRYVLSSTGSIGEFQWLTNRPYAARITAQVPSLVYFISKAHLDLAQKNLPIGFNTISSSMWKLSCYKLVQRILSLHPKYAQYTTFQLEIEYARAFIPNITKYDIFFYHEFIEAIILLDGVIEDAYTEYQYVAPTYIPKSVFKMTLHVERFSDKEGSQRFKCHSKLYIVPINGVEPRQIMILENKLIKMDIAETKVKCTCNMMQ